MNWDQYFLNICRAVATNSKCLSRQLGAIIVKDKSIISTGYNGPPRGIPPCDEWGGSRYNKNTSKQLYIAVNGMYGSRQLPPEVYNNSEAVRRYNKNGKCPRHVFGYASGKGLHLCIAGHAERNALINAARHGISVKGATLYLTEILPCKDCMIEIINAGIVEIVSETMNYYDTMSKYLMDESGIKIRTYELDK